MGERLNVAGQESTEDDSRPPPLLILEGPTLYERIDADHVRVVASLPPLPGPNLRRPAGVLIHGEVLTLEPRGLDIVNLSSGSTTVIPAIPARGSEALLESPDGRQAVYRYSTDGDISSRIGVYRPGAGAHDLVETQGRVRLLGFGPDSGSVWFSAAEASPEIKKSVRRLDLRSGAVDVVEIPTDVEIEAISPDGTRLLTFRTVTSDVEPEPGRVSVALFDVRSSPARLLWERPAPRQGTRLEGAVWSHDSTSIYLDFGPADLFAEETDPRRPDYLGVWRADAADGTAKHLSNARGVLGFLSADGTWMLMRRHRVSGSHCEGSYEQGPEFLLLNVRTGKGHSFWLDDDTAVIGWPSEHLLPNGGITADFTESGPGPGECSIWPPAQNP